jgi:hypothetical protein
MAIALQTMTRRIVLPGLALSACATQRSLEPAYVEARAPDGAPVSGYAWGGGPRGLLLVPGGHGLGLSWAPQAVRLAAAGFRVLAIDHRGYGRASAVPRDGSLVHLDVIGGLNCLGLQGARTLSVVGASWGGWAAGTAAVTRPDTIQKLVLLAHSPFKDPARLTGEKLFVVARDDPSSNGTPRLEAIRAQFEAAPEPKKLVVLEGSAHAQEIFRNAEGERLYAEMLGFLRG